MNAQRVKGRAGAFGFVLDLGFSRNVGASIIRIGFLGLP